MNEYISSASKVAGTSLAMEDWANQSVAESLITNFEEACGDGLRSNINQVRLYLEDEGMVNVLVTHVLERITEEYTVFRDVVGSLYAGAVRGSLMSVTQLGGRLQDASGMTPGKSS